MFPIRKISLRQSCKKYMMRSNKRITAQRSFIDNNNHPYHCVQLEGVKLAKTLSFTKFLPIKANLNVHNVFTLTCLRVCLVRRGISRRLHTQRAHCVSFWSYFFLFLFNFLFSSLLSLSFFFSIFDAPLVTQGAGAPKAPKDTPLVQILLCRSDYT